MKKILFTLSTCCFALAAWGDFSCGDGYMLASHSKIDGIDAAQCQKVWCMDLETGKYMGNGDKAASGYVATSSANELCDKNNNCVECYGERKWCNGERAGIWNPEYGAYTYDGGENTSYRSYQKGSCFSWRLEKPTCPGGQTAVMDGDNWVCMSKVETGETVKSSSIRRTSGVRRIIK